MRTSFKVAQEKAEARKAEKVKAQALALKAGPGALGIAAKQQAAAKKEACEAEKVKAMLENAPKEQAGGYHIKQRPPPAGVRRGGPGGWMLAQAPRKPDQDGNPIGAIEYSECYVAP
jgi:hypothetical protein